MTKETYTNAFLRSQNRHWWCQRYGVFRHAPCSSPDCRGTSAYPVDELSLNFCCEEDAHEDPDRHRSTA